MTKPLRRDGKILRQGLRVESDDCHDECCSACYYVFTPCPCIAEVGNILIRCSWLEAYYEGGDGPPITIACAGGCYVGSLASPKVFETGGLYVCPEPVVVSDCFACCCFTLYSRCPQTPGEFPTVWLPCVQAQQVGSFARSYVGYPEQNICWIRGETVVMPPHGAFPMPGQIFPINGCDACDQPMHCPSPEECAALCLGSYGVNIPAWSFTDDFGVVSNWTPQGMTICKGSCDVPNPSDCGYSGCKEVFPAGTITFPGEKPAEAGFSYYVNMRCGQLCGALNGLWVMSLSNGCNGFSFPLGYYTNGITSICAQNGVYARIPSCSHPNSPPYLQLT